MAAPQGSAIYDGVIARLPDDFDVSHPPLKEYLKGLCSSISSAWGLWQSGLLWGSNNVSGLGIGGWIGAGGGGKITQTVPFNIVDGWSKSGPDGQTDAFKKAVTDAFKEAFEKYASSFSFGTVPYQGTCTATPVSPGPFSANSVPSPIMSYKASATQPYNIAKDIRAKLPGDWEKQPLDKWLKALEGSIVENFKKWEMSAKMSGDSVFGTGSPGVGAGTGTSLGIGTIS